MSAIQQANAMKALRVRSDQMIAQGCDGFVSLEVLRFDVGLSTRALRRIYDAAVSNGELQRKSYTRADGVSRSHLYRTVLTGA